MFNTNAPNVATVLGIGLLAKRHKKSNVSLTLVMERLAASGKLNSTCTGPGSLTLTSENHRREICRQRGLTPVDGDWDLAGEIAKNESKVEEEKETYKDYYDRVHNDPAYKDFRKAIDEGRVDTLLPPE